MKGIIFNIQRFSIHDGPGIRTCLFLKGCPLRCAWCHNPESHAFKPEVCFTADKCIGCGGCAAVCPKGVHQLSETAHTLNRSQCIACGACQEACLYGAVELMGKEYTVEEAVSAAMRDKPFYLSGGGVTLTGGEPLSQPAFALAIAKALKEQGVSVAMETCGFCKSEDILAIAPYVDHFLFDVKETDEARHKEYTGVGLELIRKNLRLLDESGAQITLRCPVIPGVNDREEHFLAVAELANSMKGVIGIDVEPYHPMGIAKHLKLDKAVRYHREEFLPQEEAQPWVDLLQMHTGIPVRLS